jgi:hypothetical protein
MISVLLVSASVMALASVARADVEISNKPTSNMSCVSGVCTATAAKAVLNIGDLQTMLASGDVAVKTGSVAKDIDVDQPLQWTSTARLTLDAQQAVQIEKQVTVAGQGALTVTTNDSGTKAKNKTGAFVIVPEHGSVQFWDLNSSLIIDGATYTLIGDIKTLASDIAANPSGFYALAKPYDASQDGVYSNSPVTTPFQGAFEGLGNQIASLTISSTVQSAVVGFFGGIDFPGVVRNFRIAKAHVYASGANGVGLLVGAGNFGQIVRCHVTGQIAFTGTVSVGGLVNENEGSIADSSADVRILGSAARSVGGLAAFNDATVTSSYTWGSLALRNSNLAYAGGLVGENHGIVENSFARNRVNNGRKNNNSYFGGVTGENDSDGQIRYSYAAGEISPYSGGLVGFDAAAAGNISKSYWDLDMGVSDPSRGAGNIKNDPGITGLTTRQLQSGLPKGFNSKIWGSNPKINNGYPYLLANPPLK